MVMFAVSLAVLLGFMAIAVDGADAFVERRDSQAAVDVAAIGGALTLIDSNATPRTKAETLVNKVFELTQKNIAEPLDWQHCEDPERPTEYTVSAASVFISSNDSEYTECISWTPDWHRIRVKLPDRDIETFFAGAIGFKSIKVGAFAEVEAVVNGAGGVLPFGILSTGTNGLVCLKTGPSFPDDCDRNETGNFDFLDFRPFGNTAMRTVADCNLSSVVALKQNIAIGVDHDLGPAPNMPTDHQGIADDPSIAKEDVQCSSKAEKIQATRTETGNKQKVILDGFVEGVGIFPGRLTIGSPDRLFDCYGTWIDDVGLWQYMTDDAKTLCPNTDTEDEIVACILANPGTVLFDDDIQYAARIARVPVLHQTEWPTGAKYVSFKRFSFVYVQTLYGGCKSDGTCQLEIAPGEGAVKKLSNADPVAITAIGIPDLVLPENVRAKFGTPRVTTYALIR
jgi:hypothetical protein